MKMIYLVDAGWGMSSSLTVYLRVYRVSLFSEGARILKSFKIFNLQLFLPLPVQLMPYLVTDVVDARKKQQANRVRERSMWRHCVTSQSALFMFRVKWRLLLQIVFKIYVLQCKGSNVVLTTKQDCALLWSLGATFLRNWL